MENNIWDGTQLGVVERVLGTVGRLFLSRYIIEETKTYHRNLAVAFYDYKKAYEKVHHEMDGHYKKSDGINECTEEKFEDKT